ncbi:MAG: acyl-CoA dehydrogenase family protein [Tetrasphaera sp.]
MRWALTKDQLDFQRDLAGWLDHVADSAQVRDWCASGPSDYLEALTEAGWLAGGIPEELGGAGGGLVEVALATEAMAARAVPSGAWTASLIALPALAAIPGRVAELIEEGAYAAAAVRADAAPDGPTSVTADGDGRLTGRVPLVLGAASARTLIVPAAGPDGSLGLYAVDSQALGLHLDPRTLLDASRDAADVTMDDTPGTALDLDVRAILAEMALRAAVIVSADSLGAAQRMLDLAVEYSQQREQFGVPIGSFQAVKHAAATILVGVEAARSIVYPAAAAVETGSEMALPYAAAAKAQVGAAAVAAADSALTMHGAIGYTWEHDLQLYYKRAKLNGTLFGSTAQWNERLAGLLDLVPA